MSRTMPFLRQSCRAVAILVAILAVARLPAHAQADSRPASRAVAVAEVSMTVADLDRAVEFYTRVLGFTKRAEAETEGERPEAILGVFPAHTRAARLTLGDESIELVQFLTPQGRPYPRDARSHDRSFQHVAIIVRDMAKAYAVLRQNEVAHISPSPQRLPDWNPNAGGIEAFYFRDPDGHPLEILHFPAGKGAPKWHLPSERVFLGIDHSAITVRSTSDALAFYRDVLGMTVVGTSENSGIEQERLNAVRGARLRITTLRAERGPGVELLEYVAPDGGSPMPADVRTSDVLHRHTTIEVDDARAAARAMREKALPFVSSRVVEEDPAAASGTCFIVRDPDGHAVKITERQKGRKP